MWTALLGAASSVAGSALAPRPSAPSTAYQESGGNKWGFDNSGWNVNFGSGEIDSRATKTESDPIGLAGATSGLSMNWETVALIGLGVVAVWLIAKR